VLSSVHRDLLFTLMYRRDNLEVGLNLLERSAVYVRNGFPTFRRTFVS
jgi:hypothetical protein